jgi:aspartyl-tRNA(Asn)/glutamyl-tRNA(Gln) amidotransferase subunit C
MKIDHDIVDKLADLAKLEFDKEGKDAIVKDLSRILTFIEKLNALDTENIVPLIYMNDEVNNLREDEMKNDISQSEALKNAPGHDSDYFKMPKVIGKAQS